MLMSFALITKDFNWMKQNKELDNSAKRRSNWLNLTKSSFGRWAWLREEGLLSVAGVPIHSTTLV